MGKMNLLKANWEGKVGQTVGAKWKNKSTIRTYTKPANPSTAAQQSVRSVFRDMSAFVALFADSIKYLTSWDTSGMSVRNAILSYNKDQIADGTFEPADLIVNRGGLPNATGVTASGTAGTSGVAVAFTAPQAVNISDKAILVAVAVDKENLIAGAASAKLSAGTVSIPVKPVAGGTLDVYYYVLDFRGSNKVGSISGHVVATLA